LNTRGAAVERVELSSPKYRDLEDKSGYLGHLGLSDEAGGCRVGVVGPGTPAAQAVCTKSQVPPGLQVGDLILSVRRVVGDVEQKPEGERSMTTAEWILYNILELKFIQGQKVRDVARRLAMSESDLYRKQRVAIENVARAISNMEQEAVAGQIQGENGDG
ncbi:MAG: hypothetical protein ACK2UH_18300, partial [Candidatus Promineifilaceae bacterium]